MSRRRVAVWIVAVALLGGCGQGSNGLGIGGAGDDYRDRLRQQAHDALARYDAAVLEAGGKQVFVPVGELTGQIGDWEAAIGENNKVALNAGLVVTTATLPAAPQPTGTVTWDNGATHTVPLLPADETLSQLRQAGVGDCPECVPLEVTGARPTTVRVQTTRGPATAPAWEYTVKGTAVRVTRVAVASSAMVRVTPPSWDPYDAPGGISDRVGDHDHVQHAAHCCLHRLPAPSEPAVRRRLHRRSRRVGRTPSSSSSSSSSTSDSMRPTRRATASGPRARQP